MTNNNNPVVAEGEKKIYVFDRYVNGKLMAEGCRITKATSEADAFNRAKAMYAEEPETVFKIRETLLATALAASPIVDGVERRNVLEGKQLYRHKKTGGLYERLLPMGRVQSSSPLHDMDEVAIYRAQKDGTLWARKAREFDDGRFEPVAALSPTTGAQKPCPQEVK